jgi:hypothetical protein
VTLGATLDAIGANPVSITSSHTLINTGVVESTGTGGLTINDAVKNAFGANLFANGGDLTVTGAVTGGGAATINGPSSPASRIAWPLPETPVLLLSSLIMPIPQWTPSERCKIDLQQNEQSNWGYLIN